MLCRACPPFTVPPFSRSTIIYCLQFTVLERERFIRIYFVGCDCIWFDTPTIAYYIPYTCLELVSSIDLGLAEGLIAYRWMPGWRWDFWDAIGTTAVAAVAACNDIAFSRPLLQQTCSEIASRALTPKYTTMIKRVLFEYAPQWQEYAMWVKWLTRGGCLK